MKKKLLFAMAAGAMLFATSCQNDLDVMGNVGNEALVSFTVTTPEMVTRAYSDGLSATHLQYAVYQGESELRDLTVTDGEIHGTTTVNLQLATGNTYTVLFWAAAEDAPYTVDFGAKTMTVDYNGALSNDENRDAFYAKHTFTVTGTQTETVKLYRPFAQLNIGTADYQASEDAGYVPTKSQVKVATYSTLNLWNGSVADETTCTYAFAAIPDGEEFPVDGYEYLAMNYVLVGAKQVVDVEFSYKDEASEAKTRTVGSVPVQRNYRTNIYGNLLTSMVDINVEIVPEYNEPAYEADALYQAAAFGGEVTLTEDVVLTNPLAIQANATIDLGGKTLTGIVTVAEGVQATISNGKIVNTDNTVSGITSNGDLTLNDVEVESARHALRIESGNAVINGGTYKVVPVSNSTLYALNAGDGANSIANVTIKGGTFIGPKGTMADSGGAVTVKTGSTVNIEGGDFSGGKTKTLSSNGTLVVTGGTFDQNPATYVAGGYTTLENNGTYTVIEGIKVENTDQLETVISNAPAGSTIVLAKNVNYGDITIGEWSDVIIESEENTTMRFITTADSKIENVTLKNATFNFTTGANQKAGSFVVIDAAAKIENLVIENCTLVGDGNKNSYGIYGQNPNASIVVKDCNFSKLGYAIQATAGGGYKSLLVENCTFDTIKSWAILPQYGYNGDLEITGCTFANTNGGLVKTGAFNGTFTFTNNTITNSVGHDGKDSKWFEVNASAATKVVSGNTKDGAAWTPGAENGLN